MASTAEQFASNFSLGSFAKAKDLKKRILFTVILLVIFRLGAHIPLPGIDPAAWADVYRQLSQTGNILGFLNAFAGGAIANMSIFILTIVPYISASIIIQLLAVVSPSMEALRKEGEAGRKKLNQYTRYLTVLIAAFQAFFVAVGLQKKGVVLDTGGLFIVITVTTITAATLLLVWMGEQITARGVGNGSSLIIFAGIVSDFPRTFFAAIESAQSKEYASLIVLGIIALLVLLFAFVVFMERAYYKVLVQYPKRVVGNKQFAGDSQYLPIKLNVAGVIPAIFTFALLNTPQQLAAFGVGSSSPILATISAWLGPGQPLYALLLVLFTVFFAFFYTSIVFNPAETAENLKKSGGFIQGVRPGPRTAAYFDYILTRLTIIGALYLGAVVLVPEILRNTTTVVFYFGGTSILIMVSTCLDTIQQVQSHLMAQQYEALLKKSRMRMPGGRS